MEVGNHTRAPALGTCRAKAIDGCALVASHHTVHVFGVGLEFFKRGAAFVEPPPLIHIFVERGFAPQAVESGAKVHIYIGGTAGISP